MTNIIIIITIKQGHNKGDSERAERIWRRFGAWWWWLLLLFIFVCQRYF